MRAAEGRSGGNCRAGCEKGSKVRLVERWIGGRIEGIIGLMCWVKGVRSIWKHRKSCTCASTSPNPILGTRPKCNRLGVIRGPTCRPQKNSSHTSVFIPVNIQ